MPSNRWAEPLPAMKDSFHQLNEVSPIHLGPLGKEQIDFSTSCGQRRGLGRAAKRHAETLGTRSGLQVGSTGSFTWVLPGFLRFLKQVWELHPHLPKGEGRGKGLALGMTLPVLCRLYI